MRSYFLDSFIVNNLTPALLLSKREEKSLIMNPGHKC